MPSAISEIEQEINGLIVAVNRLAAAERQLTGGSSKNIAPSKQEWNLNQSSSSLNSGLNTHSGWQLSIPAAAAAVGMGKSEGWNPTTKQSPLAGQPLLPGPLTSYSPTSLPAPASAGFDVAKLSHAERYVLSKMQPGVRYPLRDPSAINKSFGLPQNAKLNVGLRPNLVGAPSGAGTFSVPIPLGGNQPTSPPPPWMSGRGQWNKRQRFANWMQGVRGTGQSFLDETGLSNRLTRRMMKAGAIVQAGRTAGKLWDVYSSPVDADTPTPTYGSIGREIATQSIQVAGMMAIAAAAMQPLKVSAAAFQAGRRAGVVRNVLQRGIYQTTTSGTWLRAAVARTGTIALAYTAINIATKWINYDQEESERNDRMDNDAKTIKEARKSFTSIYGGDVKEAMKQYKDRVYGENAQRGWTSVSRTTLSALTGGWVKSPEDIEEEALRKVTEYIKKAATNHGKAQEWAAKKDFKKFSSQLAQANAEMKNLAHPAWKNPKRMFQNIQAARNASRNYGHSLYTRGRERIGD